MKCRLRVNTLTAKIEQCDRLKLTTLYEFNQIEENTMEGIFPALAVVKKIRNL
jgi:hypothetical protein